MKTSIIINYFKKCEEKGLEPTLHGLYTYKLKCEAEQIEMDKDLKIIEADPHPINQYIQFCKDFDMKPVEAFGTAVKMYEIRDLNRAI